jgi:hypothetical protein
MTAIPQMPVNRVSYALLGINNLRRTVCTFIVLCCMPLLGLAQTTLAAWDLTGTGTVTATNSPAATVFNANLISASLANTISRGPGAAFSSASNSFRTVGFQNNGIAVTNTDYFQITLTAASGFQTSLATIDARFAGTSTYVVSPGVSSQFAYSLNGTTFTLIGSPQITIGTPATLIQISLSGIPALQNVPAGTTITIRYYASGQTTTGGWGFNSPSAGTYGLAIGGTVSSGAASPSITGGTVSTTAFTTTYGTASAVQTFAISGSNLTADITATAPTGFQVSSDGTTYGSTATFTQSGGSASGTLSARLAATALPGNFNNQNIVLSSTSATANITTSASGNTVLVKPLTVSGAIAQNKVYDGTSAATVTGASLVGVISGDVVTLLGGATFATAAAGTAKPVTTAYTLGGAQAPISFRQQLRCLVLQLILKL